MSEGESPSEAEIAIRRRLISRIIAFAHLVPLSLAMGIALSFYRRDPLGLVAGAGLSLFLVMRIRRLWASWKALVAAGASATGG